MNARALKRLDLGLPNDPLALTTSTFQVPGDIMQRRVMLLNRALGTAVTLSKAVGSGLVLQFIVGVVPTTTPFDVITCVTGDVFKGSLQVGINSATPGGSCQFASSSNANVTLNGTTTGGSVIGDTFWCQDNAAGVWHIWGNLIGSGTLATPFS